MSNRRASLRASHFSMLRIGWRARYPLWLAIRMAGVRHSCETQLRNLRVRKALAVLARRRYQ